LGSSSEISIRKSGKAGRITLTRPEALNALSYNMCLTIGDALTQWEDDDQVEVIIIDAEGSKSFCAGGDIADMYRFAKAGDYEFGKKFWRDEYRINARIKNYAKPYVAIMDGIVMGGGVGISAHGSHRIVTENTMFAMPECSIGLIPDVGGNLLLSKAPGNIGEYLSTTGARLGAADCIFAGIADYFVPDAKLETLIKSLEETADLGLLEKSSEQPNNGILKNEQAEINKHFSHPDALAIIHSLEADNSEWTQKAAKLIRRNSPLSVACALEIVRQSRNLDCIKDILALEYRYTSRSLAEGNFIEGIRAQIIDKDKSPKWVPATLEELDTNKISTMLNPLGEGELSF